MSGKARKHRLFLPVAAAAIRLSVTATAYSCDEVKASFSPMTG